MLGNPRSLRSAVFVLSEELYRDPLGYRSIPRLVQYIDRRNGLIALAKACWLLEEWGDLDVEAQLLLVREFIDDHRAPLASNLITEQGRTIFFRPQFLALMKYLALHGRNTAKPIEQDDLKRLGLAMLAVTDLIDAIGKRAKRERSGDDLIKDVAFDIATSSYSVRGLHTTGIRLFVVRARHLYLDIHESLDEASANDYLDINQYFHQATGVNLSDYLSIGLSIIVSYLRFRNEDRRLPDNPNFILLQPTQLFRDSVVEPEIIERIFKMISASLPHFVHTVRDQDRRELAYDFLEMKTTPLLQLDGGIFMPFSLDFLFERLTLGVYWVILDHLNAAYGRSLSNQFTRYNGFLFQEYVTSLTSELAKRTEKDAEEMVLDQLYYVGRQEHRTPDIILFGSDYAILIEASATRLQAKRTTALGIPEAFEQDCEKIIFHNVRSLNTFIENFKSGNVSFDEVATDEIRIFYPVIITIEGFLKYPIIDRFLENTIRERSLLSDEEIAGLSILHVQDLENLEGYSAATFIEALEEWHRDSEELIPDEPFSQLLDSLPKRQDESDWIGQITDRAFRESAALVFGKHLQYSPLDLE